MLQPPRLRIAAFPSRSSFVQGSVCTYCNGQPWVGATGIGDNSPMFPAADAPPIACTEAPLSTVDVDLLMIPWFEDDAPSAVPGLDRATGSEISRALASKEFGARLFDLFTTPVSPSKLGGKAVPIAPGGGGASGSPIPDYDFAFGPRNPP